MTDVLRKRVDGCVRRTAVDGYPAIIDRRYRMKGSIRRWDIGGYRGGPNCCAARNGYRRRGN